MIEYLPHLVTPQPLRFYSCFISYSHEDRHFARRLHDQLQGRGIRCWLDEHHMLPGDDIYEQVDRGIRLWDKVLLCCSRSSLQSWWADNEIENAFGKERVLEMERGQQACVLVPVFVDDYAFSDWQSGKKKLVLSRMSANFSGWEKDNALVEAEFEKLIRVLRADVGGRESPPEART